MRWGYAAAFAALATACASDDAARFARTTSTPLELAARAVAPLPDGRLAVAYEFQSQLRIFAPAADGTYVPGLAITVGTGPRAAVALGAWLVTADTQGRSLTLVDPGPAVPQVVATIPLDLPPTALAAADLDGDGIAELIVTLGTGADGALEVWQAAGDGLTQLGARVEWPGVTAAVAGDVDGDGDADLVAVVPEANQIVTWRNDGAGGLGAPAAQSGFPAPRAVAVLPDGTPAVAVTGGVMVGATLLPATGTLYDLRAADLDGDGTADLAAVDVSAHAVVVWYAATGAAVTRPISRGPISLVPADLDADGDLDLVALAYEARAVDVLWNDGP